jgi:hypothetical protein
MNRGWTVFASSSSRKRDTQRWRKVEVPTSRRGSTRSCVRPQGPKPLAFLLFGSIFPHRFTEPLFTASQRFGLLGSGSTAPACFSLYNTIIALKASRQAGDPVRCRKSVLSQERSNIRNLQRVLLHVLRKSSKKKNLKNIPKK